MSPHFPRWVLSIPAGLATMAVLAVAAASPPAPVAPAPEMAGKAPPAKKSAPEAPSPKAPPAKKAAPPPANGFEAKLRAEADAAEAAAAAPAAELKSLQGAEAALWRKIEALVPPTDAHKAADRDLKEATAALKQINPDKLQSRAEFAAYDRLVDRRGDAERALDRAVGLRRQAARKLAATTDSGRALLAESESLQKRIAAADQVAAEAAARAATAKGRLKIYTSAPPPPGKIAGDGKPLVLRPPPDVDARARRFAERNTPAALAEFSRGFFARIDLTTPGLERVAPLLAADRHAEALDAWRDALFARLREPTRHGLPANWGGDLDTASLLRIPDRKLLDEAMAGTFRTPRTGPVVVGPPGTIHWGDPGPDPAADPARNPYLDFTTMRGQGGFVDVLGPHLVLLDGYAATGERKYLDRWTEVLEDWALNAPADMERSPFNIRQYPVLCSFRPVALGSTLTDVLHAQPAVARDISSAGLARILMTVMEEYPAAFARLGRRGIYNWRCIAITGAVLTAQAFPEFRAARRQLDEARRLAELNWSHKILRDGGNLEQGNWGHEPNDQVHLGRAMRLLETTPPVWMDDLWRAEWRDNMAVNARFYLHMMKPDGFSYRFARVNTADKFVLRGRFDDPAMPIQSNLLLGESETRRRLHTVFGDHAVEVPAVTSEALPYLGAAVFRGGWEPDAPFLYFQASPNRDCNGREDAGGFALHSGGHALVLSPPFAVDGFTQNIHHGMVEHPGGKTVYLGWDERDRPVESRFHFSPSFDLAEGGFRGVYQRHLGAEAEVFGGFGPAKPGPKFRAPDEPAIRDVSHDRQVLSLRGEDVVIVTDRLRSGSLHVFQQHYTLFTPVPKEGWKRRTELAREGGRHPLTVDAAGRTLRTDNGALPGLTIRHFGAVAPKYAVLEDLFGRIGDADTSDEALAALGSPKLKKWTMGLPLPFLQKVRMDVPAGAGATALVSVFAVRPGDDGSATGGVAPGGAAAGDLHEVEAVESPGVHGFRAVTRHGTKVLFAAAVEGPTTLRIDGADAVAETLLLTRGKAGTSGIALGCRRLIVDGKEINAGATDFEFALRPDAPPAITPIHRPIRPVVIAADATVFTDRTTVELSCPTPGVEIRYTLDGSDPTHDSTPYERPFKIGATTRVKARAFRPGLTVTPWTADGTHAGATSWTTFRKVEALPAVAVDADAVKPGLAWEYVEGRWAQLFMDADLLPAAKSGNSSVLPDVSMRSTDGAFAVRHTGLLTVPSDGVYTFHAPREWMLPDGECGYELRLFVHGKLWDPATRRHAHGAWSVALAKGAHPFRVEFVDMRPRKLKPELWDNFPNPEIVWKGTAPVIELSGPEHPRGPLPAAWLRHVPGDRPAAPAWPPGIGRPVRSSTPAAAGTPAEQPAQPAKPATPVAASAKPAPVKAADQPGLVRTGFIYESGPHPQVHATTIADTPTGLVAAWFGGTKEGHKDVGIWVSRHDAGKWTAAMEVADGRQPDGTRHPAWNPVLFQPREGPLMLFYKVGPNPEQWWGELKTSADGGKSWGAATRLPAGILGPIKNKPLQLADGSVLSPSSDETRDRPGKWLVHFEHSSDLGKTWRKIGPVHDGTAIRAIQPSILSLGGDKLLAVGRTRNDRIFEVRSDDGGRTWGAMTLGALPNNNSGTDAVTLRDGRHLIIYNHVAGTPGQWGGKRTPLNIAVSKDGTTWEAALVLESDSGEYSYPSIIQSADGLVHATWTWKRVRVKHAVIDPAKLVPRPMKDGAWPAE